MEEESMREFVCNKLKIFENSLSKMFDKFEYLDNRLQTLECSLMHMDEKDLKASSEIKSGLNPLRSDIMELKTGIREVEVLNQSRDAEIRKESEKTAKKIKNINKEIENVALLVKEEKYTREQEIKEVKDNILLQVNQNLS